MVEKINKDEDLIDFNVLKKLVDIEDKMLFEIYLCEVYKDLTDRVESSKKQGVGKITFLDYMKLKVFISEKIFMTFDVDGDGFLNLKEFVDGLMTLYLGNLQETAQLIFNIFDFDKDGLINRGDIKITMSYLPLKDTTHKIQMESLTELDEILDIYFKEKKTINFKEFLDTVKNKKSDLYLQLLCFIYDEKPFNKHNIEACRNLKKKKIGDSSVSPTKKSSSGNSPELGRKDEKVYLKSPSKKSRLLPATTFLGLDLNSDESNISIKVPNNPQKKKGIEMSELENVKEVLRLPNSQTKEGGSIMDSPSKFLKKGPKEKGTFSICLNDMSDSNKDSLNTLSQYTGGGGQVQKQDSKKTKEIFTFNDWVYKLTENNNIKKYYLTIIGKDIYYYKSDKKEELQGMHNLTGCFVNGHEDSKLLDGKKLYGFSIIFSNKTRDYYCLVKKDRDSWVNALKTSIGYQTFQDIYDLGIELGEGKFGLVRLGIHKKTEEKVAIKIIKKSSMDNKDLELVRSEIDIMKLCKHKNIVRLLDHFENFDFIFIVMEYLAGGDLGSYAKKRKYNFSESEVCLIIYQITLGIDYLHKYGVAHRDLKPDNIMLVQQGSIEQLKIMDFGLSKILGPNEKVADGFGTLSFVAPEVLVRSPYNKEVDIWSVGITLYYILTGTLPFDDEEDNEEVIAKKIVFSKLTFYDKKWQKISDLCMDFVEKALIKYPDKRYTSKQLLNHDWFKNCLNKKYFEEVDLD